MRSHCPSSATERNGKWFGWFAMVCIHWKQRSAASLSHVFATCRCKNIFAARYKQYVYHFIPSGCAAEMVKAGNLGYEMCACCRLSTVRGNKNAEIDFVFVRGHCAIFLIVTGNRSSLLREIFELI